jgi:hypothetical protein
LSICGNAQGRIEAVSDETFQWSFIGVIALAITLIILAAVGVIPGWVIAMAIVGGIAGNTLLLYYMGKRLYEPILICTGFKIALVCEVTCR